MDRTASDALARAAFDGIQQDIRAYLRTGDRSWLELAQAQISAELDRGVAKEVVGWAYEVRQRGNNSHLWSKFMSAKRPSDAENIRNIRPRVFGDCATAPDANTLDRGAHLKQCSQAIARPCTPVYQVWQVTGTGGWLDTNKDHYDSTAECSRRIVYTPTNPTE